MNFYSTDNKTALEAKGIAQWIAFGPVVFQVARVMRNNGILKVIEDSASEGLSLLQIVEKTGLSEYGVRVLLESGLSIGLVTVSDDGIYKITRTGYFILHDDLTRVNMNFINDVCYHGLFDLDKSIETGKPVGLKVFGDKWNTVYEALSELPPHVQKSWFEFDHFFSDNAFHLVLHHVMKTNPKKMLEIGSNTGKWAIAATKYDPDVQITMMDLPGQLNVAKQRIAENGIEDRVHFREVNILDESQPLPAGHDTIWMSQFLDCFSEDEIVSILRRCYAALDDDGQVFIMEPFWDLQKYETAAFCLHQTSIYFTAIANGNSQMYDSRVFIKCIERAGFEVTNQIDKIGLSQSLLQCKKRK
jgi:hypothetical protein